MGYPLPIQPACPVCGDPQVNPKTLGLRFELDPETGEVFCKLRWSQNDLGFVGRVHGGLLALVLDEAMAWACAARARSFCTTGELKLKLKKAVPPDVVLDLRAWVEEARGAYLRARGEVRKAGDELLVAAQATFAQLPRAESLKLRRFLRFAAGDFDVLEARVATFP